MDSGSVALNARQTSHSVMLLFMKEQWERQNFPKLTTSQPTYSEAWGKLAYEADLLINAKELAFVFYG